MAPGAGSAKFAEVSAIAQAAADAQVKLCTDRRIPQRFGGLSELVVTEYRPLEIYSLLILEYLVLVLIISFFVRWLERKMGADESR